MRTFQKSEFDVCPKGGHIATVTAVAFLGKHLRKFDDAPVELVGIEYETEHGRISEELPLRTHPKSNLYKRFKAILGHEPVDGLQFGELLGCGCYVAVDHREWQDMTFANVANVSPAPSGISLPEPSRAIDFDAEDVESSSGVELLNKKWRNRIANRITKGNSDGDWESQVHQADT